MTATDEPALLRAILADPADDTVRLAYADWLDENVGTVPCARCKGKGWYSFRGAEFGYDTEDCGDCKGIGSLPNPRAEFIRVQVGLARLPDYWTAETADEVHRLRRERELWDDRRNVEWFPLPNGVALELGNPPAQATSTAFVSRGFVSAIHCTAAVFLGGPCRRCGGSGRMGGEMWADDNPCPGCFGTGRVEGIARAVFAAHPVTSVTLSDKQPLQADDSVGWGRPAFVWFGGPALAETSPHHLPDSLIFSCRGFYPTRDAALAALSAACCRYGRAAPSPGLPAGSPAPG